MNQMLVTARRVTRRIGSAVSPRRRYGPAISKFGFGPLSIFVLLAFSLGSTAQPKSDLTPAPPLDPVEGARQAGALVTRLLEQRPEQALTNTAVLKIRDREGNQRDVSARFEVVPLADRWLNIYEAAGTSHSPPTSLTIIHNGQQPND